MIFKILDNVRGKSETVRRQIAAITTVVIMCGIVFLWIGTLPSRFSATTEETKKDISPFSVLAEQGKVFYDSATDGVSSARNALESEILPAAAALSSGTTSPTFSDEEEIEEEIIAPDLLGDSPF